MLGETARTPNIASPASPPMTTTPGMSPAAGITRHNLVRSVSARVTENTELSFGAAGTASGVEIIANALELMKLSPHPAICILKK